MTLFMRGHLLFEIELPGRPEVPIFPLERPLFPSRHADDFATDTEIVSFCGGKGESENGGDDANRTG
jgi:hypothetical protein